MRELLLRTRRLVGTLAVPVVAATAVVGVWGAAPAGAAAPCLTTDFDGVRLIDWDGYNPKVEFSAPTSVSLAAGTYDLSGTSYDEYPARVGVTQLSEIWDVEFLAADGSVIARSATSGDLPDLVRRGEWAGSLGSVTLDRAAVAVRARHRPDAVGDGTADSVVPGTITICGGDVGATTTVPDVTAPPPTSPVVSSTPPTTAPPSSAPPTTAPATTGPPTSVGPDTSGPSPTTVPIQATTAPTTTPTKVAAETTVVPPPSASLASTGTEISGLQGTGLVLLGLGAVLLGVRTARRDEG